MRKFGIELEMVAPSALLVNGPIMAAQRVLQDANVIARGSSTHLGRDYSVWQCKPDGSIQPYNRGVEVVSRILPASPESYTEVTTAVAALDAAGFGINRTCGFHVHISVADVPMYVRQLIVLRYAAMQSEINAFLPPSRRSGNQWCPALSSDQRAQLARNIDQGEPNGMRTGHYSVTNMQWIDSGSNARIEFRQAAGTCNPAKVVGWVRFLQDFIDETVARATAPGVRFGGIVAPRPAPVAPYQAPRPMTVVPRMRAGSDAHRALECLRTTGVITSSWAATQGIGDNVLRRIIVGFRRHGADLNTVRGSAGPSYVLNGARNLPMTAEQVFASATPAAPVAPAPVAEPVAPVAARHAAAQFVAYPFAAGLSADVTAWIRERRDTFNADREQSDAA